MTSKIKIESPPTLNSFFPCKTIQNPSIANLFFDLQRETFFYLNKKDVNALSLSCKTLYQAGNDPGLWKYLFQRDFPHHSPTSCLLHQWKEQYRFLSCSHSNLKKGNFRITQLKSHTSAINTVNSTIDLLLTSSSNGIHTVKKSDVLQTFQQLSIHEKGEFFLNSKQDLLIHHPSGFLKALKKMENGTFIEKQILGDGTPIVQFHLNEDYLFYVTNGRTLECFKKTSEEIFQKIGSFDHTNRALHKEGYLFTITLKGHIEIRKEDENGIFQKLQPKLNLEQTRGQFSWMAYEKEHLICGKVTGMIKILKKNENGVFIDFQSFGATQVFNLVSAFKAKDDMIYCGLSRGEIVIWKKQENHEFKLLQTLKQHKEKITTIEWDGNYLLAGSIDSTVSVWEQNADGEFNWLQTLSDPKHIEGVTALKIEGTQFLVGYGDGSVKIWDFSN